MPVYAYLVLGAGWLVWGAAIAPPRPPARHAEVNSAPLAARCQSPQAEC